MGKPHRGVLFLVFQSYATRLWKYAFTFPGTPGRSKADRLCSLSPRNNFRSLFARTALKIVPAGCNLVSASNKTNGVIEELKINL